MKILRRDIPNPEGPFSGAEITLMIHILNRAIKDLDNKHRQVRKDAVYWLSNNKRSGLPRYFSYKDILDYVPMIKRDIEFIENKVWLVGRGLLTNKDIIDTREE